MANRNGNGTFDDLEVRYKRLNSESGGTSITATADGFDMYQVFEQLTASQIVMLIPDQSTFTEVLKLINEQASEDAA